MDGENHGKPHVLMDDLGGKPTIFRKHPYLPKRFFFHLGFPNSTVTKISDFRMFAFWCIMQAKVWGLAWQGFCKFYIFVLDLLKHFLTENAEPLLSWPDEAVCRTLNSSRGWKKDGKLAEGTYMLQGMVILPHCHLLWLLPFTSSMAMLGSTTNQPWEP